MTTVVDPSGTPSIIYNRSGVTVVEVTSTEAPASPAQISNVVSGRTVALVDPTLPQTNTQSVRLPANCEIGDVVEVYLRTAYSFGCDVLPPGGGEDFFAVGSVRLGVNDRMGLVARKVSATKWTFV